MAPTSSKKQKSRAKRSLSELKTLGQQLLSSRAHVNNLPILLTYITSSSPPQYALEALLSLQAFFTPLLPELPSSEVTAKRSGDSNPDPEVIYRTWLRAKFDELVQSLINVVISSHSEDALRELMLEAVMEFVKVGNAGKFHSAIYHKLLQTIVHSSLDVGDIVLNLLASKYFNYVDVRYFTYISLGRLAGLLLEAKDDKNKTLDVKSDDQSSASLEQSIRKINYLLSHVPPLEAPDEKPDYDMWNGLGIFIKKSNHKKHVDFEDKEMKGEKSTDEVLSAKSVARKMKLKFTRAWMSFLRLPLPLDVYKEVLVALHQAVIPYLSNPIMLCDFLTKSYDIGGVVSVMALSSLYILMTQHGLEYPNFYDKLYALLEPSVFMAKYRAKFFELLDSCLKSPLLPAYLAAAFCKKLTRLVLCIPPSGALVIITLVNNLLHRHPSINFLVHLEGDLHSNGEAPQPSNDIVEESKEGFGPIKDSSGSKLGIDHFNFEESDPRKANAMRSSLWEIDTLRHHYCPPVSRFVLSLENDLGVRVKTSEIAVKDFSSGSYATIFGSEIRRRVKQVPLAVYQATPTSLFSESDFPGWTFKLKDEELDRNNTTKIVNTSEDHDQISAKRQRIECS